MNINIKRLEDLALVLFLDDKNWAEMLFSRVLGKVKVSPKDDFAK